jgi:hypothetical protein
MFLTTTSANCPTRSVAVAGGLSFADPTAGIAIQSFPMGASAGAPTGWTATGANNSLTATNTFTVYAVCIASGS